MQMKLLLKFLLFGIILYSSCSTRENPKQDIVITDNKEAVVSVDTTFLNRKIFSKQIVCNGKLVAIRKANLAIPSQGGLLKEVYVHNGSFVHKGDLLAITDQRDELRELDKAQHDLERAKVEFLDKLIGIGYDDDLSNVPDGIRHRIEIMSGYYSANHQLHLAETALEDCKLIAPFNGVIADLEAHPYQRGDKFCTLIDNSYFDVEFSILENELPIVNQGTPITVSPFVYETMHLSGQITEINPTINEKGLIKVKARIKNNNKNLVNGMNVKVIVENSIPNVFVVPKSSVVERDGFNVIFLYNEGHSEWVYVDIIYANLTQYAIVGSERKNTILREGDILITSGNQNLADGTIVRVN